MKADSENIFVVAENCLYSGDVEAILACTQQAGIFFKSNGLNFEDNGSPRSVKEAQFPERPLLLPPKEMPKRSLNTVLGVQAFFHAIAHIEFIAIYLAWDLLYRFRGLPLEFYHDWLSVAVEEAEHFSMIREHLLAMGVDYGDYPAHNGLWTVAEDTADDLLMRLAFVPRYLEARGLDVTPPMIEKFNHLGDYKSAAILQRILDDEVRHVKLGSYWFKYVCSERGLNDEESYLKFIRQRFKGAPTGGVLNKELRYKAGFSPFELEGLEHWESD
ncbi:MAG: ferritin-like domain-containing protein [Methylococcales bacterium]|jgi:uncharacterized ferritin-like protein (DUF455 family)|nr:ferritin-like domain-containing protein [Methylococcales bacterium]MBT3698492.1 ferritin-like domain-containing protein [Methylococcales bacterium]MBT3816417.1 ferritin-like domain-containing protein [Methylococcales bacterium]MBT5952669.1 ferritin-like domain-containing protein [Methylococcales bacterium]MBT7109067.1 ferritin-like domain-containing protein [Methylococcales bacterium]